MSRNQLRFVCVVMLASGSSAFADWTYNPSTGHWYDLTPTGLTWTQAEDWAAKHGAHLVTINNAAENAWVLAQFGVSGQGLWIGLYQLPGSTEPAGGWTWVSGGAKVDGYSNWAPGEPNQYTGSPEDCATMYAPDNANGPGKWNDDQCFILYILGGVIERELDPAIPTVSEWGLVVMTLLTLTAGTIILVRPRRARR